MHAMTKVGWRRAARVAFGAALAVPFASRGSPAQQVTYSGSIQGSTGNYVFPQRTTSVAFFNQMGVQAGRLGVWANVPIIYQTTPWVTFGGVGPVPSGGPEHAMVGEQIRQRRQGGGGPQAGPQGARMTTVVTVPDTGTYSETGFGDPMLGGDLQLLAESASRPSISLTAGVKAPMASTANGFSTGKWDYGAGLGVARSIGRTLFSVDGAYWVLGDMPGLALRDVFSYSAALGRALGDGGWSVLGSFAGSQATVDGIDPAATVGLTVNRSFPSGTGVYTAITAGLTSSSPEVGLSVGWHVPLSRGIKLPPAVAARAP